MQRANRHLITVVAVLLAAVAQPALAQVESGVYEVVPGSTIEMCGGWGGGCSNRQIEGSLQLEIDADAGSARLVSWKIFWVVNESYGALPIYDCFDWVQMLASMPDSSTVTLSNSYLNGWESTISITAAEGGAVLHGILRDRCNDAYQYTFDQVPLVLVARQPSAIPAAGTLGLATLSIALGVCALLLLGSTRK